MVKKQMPKSETKKRNRSSKFRIPLLSFKNRFNRGTLIAVVLVVVAVGGFVTYKSLASQIGFSGYDEAVQYANINVTRKSLGLSTLSNASCLNSIARNWSKTMATTVDPVTHEHFRHNSANLGNEIISICGHHWTMYAENIAASNGCPNSTTDSCSQNLYYAFVSAKEQDDYHHGLETHYGNIINPTLNYVGVGSYRDGNNGAWITQDFMQCVDCGVPTYPVWFLQGSATVSSATAARAANITVKRGQTFSYYHNVKNLGPSTATYPEYIQAYHYSPSGALLYSNKINPGTRVTAQSDTYSWGMNSTVPTTAASGEKYCHRVYYSYYFGPGTAGNHSNLSCATVQ